VCVSLGGVFLLAFLAIGLFWFIKKKKKPVLMVSTATCVEERQHIRETITTDQCGEQTMTVTIDDDVQVHEVVGMNVEGPQVVTVRSPPYESGEIAPSTSQGHIKNS
jgi:hypothetical protein